jgi:hypothetical protein
MAGDWIKVEKATARKPEVMAIADSLGVHIDHAFGLCVRFWSWCDDQMADGHANSVTNVTLDSAFGHDGFASALIKVGWLRVRNGSLEVPNFDRHLSESAKNRALSRSRKQKERYECVTKLSRSERDKSVTREEKRREEKEHTHTASDPPDEFRKPGWAAVEWDRWLAEWNQTERAQRWDHLTPPHNWVDLAASPGWLECAREALAMLPSRRYFATPVPMTRFFEFIDRIRAGEFAEPKAERQMAGSGARTPRRGTL